MFIRRLLLTLAALTTFLLPSVSAEEIQIYVNNYALIDDGNGHSRALMRFEIPEAVTDSNLVFAEFSFAMVPYLVENGLLRVDCYAVTTDWNLSDVRWDFPWQIQGGDFDDNLSSMFTTINTSQEIGYFDLTNIVKTWLNNGAANFGLIFIVPADISSSYQIQNLPDPPGAIAEVKFTVK